MLRTHREDAGAPAARSSAPAFVTGVGDASRPSGRAAWTNRIGRLLNVVDVAVALPALISATALWGAVTAAGH